MTESISHKNDIPEAIKKRLLGWHIKIWVYSICHYLFGIGGVLSSTLSASLTDNYWKTIWSVSAAVCIAIVGFSNPYSLYRKYVSAWRMLNSKVVYYNYGIITIRELLESMDEAENSLGHYEKYIDKETENTKRLAKLKVDSKTKSGHQ